MGHEVPDLVDRLTAAATDAKAVNVELAATIKDGRKLLREITDLLDRDIPKQAHDRVEAELQTNLQLGLDELGRAISTARETSVARVIAEFDRLKNVLMFGNDKGLDHDGSGGVPGAVARVVAGGRRPRPALPPPAARPT